MLDAQHPLTEDDMTLRFIGTTSDDGDCPTLYEIPETEEILVQGDIETDPGHLAELRDVKPSESFVRVPRSLLTRYAPRTPAPELVPFKEISHLFSEFRHTAWRLETRTGYASDRNSPKWARWVAGEDISTEPDNAWRDNVRAQVAQGKRFERVRLVDEPATQGRSSSLRRAWGTWPRARTSATSPAGGPPNFACPTTTSGFSIPRSSPASRSMTRTPLSACTSRRTRPTFSPPAKPATRHGTTLCLPGSFSAGYVPVCE